MPRFSNACAAVAAALLAGTAHGALPDCSVTAIDAENVQIVISGDEGNWMACGFGGTSAAGGATMDTAYAIIVKADGSVVEHQLGSSSAGTELATSGGTVSYDVATSGYAPVQAELATSVDSVSGTRTATMTRAMAGSTAQHHTFAVGDIEMLRATGNSAWPNYHAEREATSVTLAAPRSASLPRCEVTAVDAYNVQIVISGDANSWMACGFGGGRQRGATGGATMETAYAIIVKADCSVVEHQLGNSSPGTELATSVTVSSTESVNGVCTVTLTRARAGATAQHHNFNPGRVDMLKAKGNAAWPSYHGNWFHREANVMHLYVPMTTPIVATAPMTTTTIADALSGAPTRLSIGTFAVLVATAAMMVE